MERKSIALLASQCPHDCRQLLSFRTVHIRLREKKRICECFMFLNEFKATANPFVDLRKERQTGCCFFKPSVVFDCGRWCLKVNARWGCSLFATAVRSKLVHGGR